MKLGLWKNAIAHKALLNTELYIFVQDRKHEPNIKLEIQPQSIRAKEKKTTIYYIYIITFEEQFTSQNIVVL